MRRLGAYVLVGVVAASSACDIWVIDPSPLPEDAGEPDDGPQPQDGGLAILDAGPELPLAGFGALSGDCDVLDDELTAAAPALVVNRIDFAADSFDQQDNLLLTQGGQEMLSDGNAGGSSLLSEVFAYEVLARCELAALVKTETEIAYTAAGSITDLSVQLDGLIVGVSVTRAVSYPPDAEYTVETARTLLEEKLSGIHESTANVAEGDRWVKQILSVVAYGDAHAASITTALAQIDTAMRGDTIVVLTITDGDDEFLY